MLATQLAAPAPHLHSLYSEPASMSILAPRQAYSLAKIALPTRRAPPPPPKRRNAVCYAQEENPFADPSPAAPTSSPTTSIATPSVPSTSTSTPPLTQFTRSRRASIMRGNSNPFASSRAAPPTASIPPTPTPRPNPNSVPTTLLREQRNMRARAVAYILLYRTCNRGRPVRTVRAGERMIHVSSSLSKSVIGADDLVTEIQTHFGQEGDTEVMIQDWPEDVEGF